MAGHVPHATPGRQPQRYGQPDTHQRCPRLAAGAEGEVVMSARPRFVITFSPGVGVDGIRALRLLLKSARRRFGLVAVDVYEDRSSPLELSNKSADDFRELRDAIVEERAQKWSSRS